MWCTLIISLYEPVCAGANTFLWRKVVKPQKHIVSEMMKNGCVAGDKTGVKRHECVLFVLHVSFLLYYGQFFHFLRKNIVKNCQTQFLCACGKMQLCAKLKKKF